MDFITHLPKTKGKHDALFVVVDRLSKYAKFIPTKMSATAVDTARLFFERVCVEHGVPKSIVSDWDSKFTSKFWQEFWLSIGTKLKMSTAYHPQTERTNRTLEQVLLAVCLHNQQE